MLCMVTKMSFDLLKLTGCDEDTKASHLDGHYCQCHLCSVLAG